MHPQFVPLYRRDNGTANSAVSEAVTGNNATETGKPTKNSSGGGFPSFLIAIIVVGAIAAIIFAVIIVFRRRAVKRRAFGDSNGPNFEGARQGLSSIWYKIKNPRARSTNAGFEGISAGRAGNRNAGRALDPDEAWDSRVGHEADGYYEDTELQGTMGYVETGNTAYTGASRGGMPSANPFGDEHAAAAAGRKSEDNPFGDEQAAPPLRSMSPRPLVDTAGPSAAAGTLTPTQTSPTRKSIFKEET